MKSPCFIAGISPRSFPADPVVSDGIASRSANVWAEPATVLDRREIPLSSLPRPGDRPSLLGQPASSPSSASTPAHSFPQSMDSDGGRDADPFSSFSDLPAPGTLHATSGHDRAAVSFAGASAVHEGDGIWFYIVPGLGSGRAAFGFDLAFASFALSELVWMAVDENPGGTVPAPADHAGTE